MSVIPTLLSVLSHIPRLVSCYLTEQVSMLEEFRYPWWVLYPRLFFRLINSLLIQSRFKNHFIFQQEPTYRYSYLAVLVRTDVTASELHQQIPSTSGVIDVRCCQTGCLTLTFADPYHARELMENPPIALKSRHLTMTVNQNVQEKARMVCPSLVQFD